MLNIQWLKFFILIYKIRKLFALMYKSVIKKVNKGTIYNFFLSKF